MPDDIVTVIAKYYVRTSVSRRYRGSAMESEPIVVKLAGQADFAFSTDIMEHMLLVIRGIIILLEEQIIFGVLRRTYFE